MFETIDVVVARSTYLKRQHSLPNHRNVREGPANVNLGMRMAQRTLEEILYLLLSTFIIISLFRESLSLFVTPAISIV